MPDDLTRELAEALRPLARLHDIAVEEGGMDRGHMVSFLGSIQPEELRAAARALARFDAREPNDGRSIAQALQTALEALDWSGLRIEEADSVLARTQETKTDD